MLLRLCSERIETARFPQRVSPYAFAAGNRCPPVKAEDAQGQSTGFMAFSDVSKTTAEVQVTEEWGDIVSILQRSLSKNVFTDYYTPPDSDREKAERQVRGVKAPDAPTFLDDLCKRWQRVWWEQSGAICIRQQFWYMLSQCEPPLPVRRQLEGDVRAGKLRTETLNALATLTRPQILTLLQQTAPDAEFEVDESAFADFLELYKAGTVGDHQAIAGEGLPLSQFSPGLMEALRRLAPDSRVLKASQQTPSEFFLKVEQEAVNRNEDAPKTYSLLTISCFGACERRESEISGNGERGNPASRRFMRCKVGGNLGHNKVWSRTCLTESGT